MVVRGVVPYSNSKMCLRGQARGLIYRRLVVILSLLLGLWWHTAHASDGLDLTLSPPTRIAQSSAPTITDPTGNSGGIDRAIAAWEAWVARARATQPAWSTPLVTTTGLLEQRIRFDVDLQHAGNGTSSSEIDGGRGLDLIVSETTEIQIGVAPYYIRTGVAGSGPKGKGSISSLAGFGDWPFFRIEERLASSPESDGDYVLTALLQIQAPTGIARLTSNAWEYLPTVAFGKGWGNFDIQSTVGGVVPASDADTIGYQILTNVALQYHIMAVLWPQLEVNWTYYVNGQRGGLHQVYLTPGLVVGRFSLSEGLRFTFGVGYQVAVLPDYRPKPLIPAYNHAWIFTTRLNF